MILMIKHINYYFICFFNLLIYKNHIIQNILNFTLINLKKKLKKKIYDGCYNFLIGPTLSSSKSYKGPSNGPIAIYGKKSCNDPSNGPNAISGENVYNIDSVNNENVNNNTQNVFINRLSIELTLQSGYLTFGDILRIIENRGLIKQLDWKFLNSMFELYFDKSILTKMKEDQEK